MDKVTVIILSEDGSYLSQECCDLLLNPIQKQYEIANAPTLNHVMMQTADEENMPFGNAMNDPAYLLGAIEESEFPVIVIVWKEDETGFPRPGYLFGDDEIDSLMKALDQNKNEDAWAVAAKVHTEIREKEENS